MDSVVYPIINAGRGWLVGDRPVIMWASTPTGIRPVLFQDGRLEIYQDGDILDRPAWAIPATEEVAGAIDCRRRDLVRAYLATHPWRSSGEIIRGVPIDKNVAPRILADLVTMGCLEIITGAAAASMGRRNTSKLYACATPTARERLESGEQEDGEQP